MGRYLVLVMFLYFLVNCMLLVGVNRMAGFPSGWGYSALAAALGAVCCGLCLMPAFSFLRNVLWRLVILGAMGLIAFAPGPEVIKRTGIFLLLSAALSALSLGIGREDPVCLCFSVCILVCVSAAATKSDATNEKYISLEISHGGKSHSLVALRDTGNTLSDPITGEQVLVVSGSVARKLTGLTQQQLRSPLDAIAGKTVPGLRLIPYRFVGGSGLLLAKRFEKVMIGRKTRRMIVAFAPEELGNGRMYQALTGGAI